MDQSMEISLLGMLLNKEVYESVSGMVNADMFTDEVGAIAEVLVEAHSSFDGNISVTELHALHQQRKVLSQAQQGALSVVYDKLSLVGEGNKDIASSLLKTLYVRSVRYKALDMLARAIETGADSHEDVMSILTDENAILEDEYKSISTEASELMEFFDPSKQFSFRLQNLEKRVPGISRGNFAIFFGRPEVGKSSFTADCVAGWIESGHKVLYFANEEPGRKIMLNIKRSVLGITDDIMRSDPEQVYPAWEHAKQFIDVKEVGEASIEGITAYAHKHKPDIIILDQIDKLSMAEKFNAGHERLKALYGKARTLAKTKDCLVVGITQASAEAKAGMPVTYDMMDGSKTGKAGEADLVIGIGTDLAESAVTDGFEYSRYLYISKNKLNGVHGRVDAMFNAKTNQWRPM